MELPVKLESFEGPLDLLLHLIDKNKINIYDIPIVMITEQYMDYVNHMSYEDLDRVSEFLVMAATLLEIKARMLLPSEQTEEDEEGDPREELVQRLLEYRKFKLLGTDMRDMEVGSEHFYYRAPLLPEEVARYRPPLDLDEFLKDVSLPGLRKLFDEMLRRQEERIDPRHSHFGEIEREAVEIGDRLDFVRSRIRQPGRHSFRALLASAGSRLELIVTFLAVLELVHTGELSIREDGSEDFILEDSAGSAPAAEAETNEN